MLNVGILHSAMEGNPHIKTEVHLHMYSAVLCLPQKVSKLMRQSHGYKYIEELKNPDHPHEKASTAPQRLLLEVQGCRTRPRSFILYAYQIFAIWYLIAAL